MGNLVCFLADRFLFDDGPGGVVEGGEKEHAFAASVLGSSDFFPVDSDHRLGSIGSALSCLLADPLVDHRVEDDRVDSGCRPMDRGQGRGSASMQVEPVSLLSARPFGDHRQRFRARDHRAHDRQQQQQQLEGGVADTASMAGVWDFPERVFQRGQRVGRSSRAQFCCQVAPNGRGERQ